MSFAIAQPKSFEQASALLRDERFRLPVLKAGGMDMVDHLKEGLIEPDLLIDVKRLKQRRDGEDVLKVEGHIEIAAHATMSQIVESALIEQEAPVVAQALENAATPQVRNVGTAAGNLLQRPRCWYYRNDQFHCLKKGGDTCFAVEGENRYHAIFGGGPCHIVHPSNLAIALMVCDAVVHLVGGQKIALPISQLYHLPGEHLESEDNLEAGHVVTHITLSPQPKSGFYAIKEKQSFDWPLVMCAVVLELDGSVIKSAQVCAGAVAPVPWMLPKVAQALAGVNVENEAALMKACAASVEGAAPMRDNGYKVKLLPVAVRRAVLRAAGRPYEPGQAEA